MKENSGLRHENLPSRSHCRASSISLLSHPNYIPVILVLSNAHHLRFLFSTFREFVDFDKANEVASEIFDDFIRFRSLQNFKSPVKEETTISVLSTISTTSLILNDSVVVQIGQILQ